MEMIFTNWTKDQNIEYATSNYIFQVNMRRFMKPQSLNKIKTIILESFQKPTTQFTKTQ
jgi:hypothetical protein